MELVGIRNIQRPGFVFNKIGKSPITSRMDVVNGTYPQCNI